MIYDERSFKGICEKIWDIKPSITTSDFLKNHAIEQSTSTEKSDYEILSHNLIQTEKSLASLEMTRCLSYSAIRLSPRAHFVPRWANSLNFRHAVHCYKPGDLLSFDGEMDSG